MPRGRPMSAWKRQAIVRDIRSQQLPTAVIASKYRVHGQTIRDIAKEIGCTLPHSEYTQVNHWSAGPANGDLLERREREKRLLGIRSQDMGEQAVARAQAKVLGLTRWERDGVVLIGASGG